jgi:zona occludens toxin (predicted ATPase)
MYFFSPSSVFSRFKSLVFLNSIHVNWGAPGSYKTSHSVLEAIPVLLGTNRFFVTNVRGLNPDTVYRYFGKKYPNYLPPFRNLRFFNISTELLELDPLDLESALRYFPLWLPFGSYFLFDEIQLIYPKNFSSREFTTDFSNLSIRPIVWELSERFSVVTEELVDENISTLRRIFVDEYSISPENPEFLEKFGFYIDNVVLSRPKNLLEAFSKHRHYGWDLSFTCQDLSQVSTSVLDICESAHYQQNMRVNFSFLGKGRYKRFFHSAQKKSPSPSDIGTFHRIDTRIFQCYSSTQLGQASDTLASQNPFITAPFLKLYFLLIVLFGCLYYFFSNYEHLPFFIGKNVENQGIYSTNTTETVPKIENSISGDYSQNIENSEISISQNSTSSTNFVRNIETSSRTHRGVVASEDVLDDFQREDVRIYISGYYRYRRTYRYAGQLHYPDGSISMFRDLPPFYHAKPFSSCYYALYRLDRLIRYVHCPPQPHQEKRNSERLRRLFHRAEPTTRSAAAGGGDEAEAKQ